MSVQPYIRSVSERVPFYARNCNEILTNEFLYEGDAPNDADPADYLDASTVIKAATRSGVRLA